MLRPSPKKMSASVLGIDTNVLIRFLTADDPVQSAQARRLLSRRENQPIYVSLLVLVEAFNVMTKVKKQPVDAVLESYRLLLRSPAVNVEDADIVSLAIEDASRTRAGFADALIALQNAQAHCVATATFDVRAIRLDAMRPVEDFV